MSIERLAVALSDRYSLVREIGAGGMATVYLAHDLKHQRDVAIKVLHPDLGAALGSERFLSEIRTTARLQHPHILPLLDSGTVVAKAGRGDPAALAELGGGDTQSTTFLYYVMPLVTGETLRTRLDRERQLPIADALLIAREVADALGHAHSLGVIHRDIKPENILLQGGHALVADFGIALAVQQAGGQRMTQTGLSLGTPQYMSPEQAMGERTIDARSDIYALGAVTYEMLTGDAPFTGSSVQAIVAKIMTEKPTPVHTLRDTVPEHVEAAVLQALAKLPADRFVSASAFAQALDNAVFRHRATSGAVPGTGRRPGWQGHRGVGLALALVIAGVGAVAGWAVTRGDAGVRDIGLPADAPMSLSGWDRRFAVAANGAFIVYVASTGSSTQLYRRDLQGQRVEPIAGTEGAAGLPLLSPDGRRVAFGKGVELRVVNLTGGPSVAIAPTGGINYWGAWLTTDLILMVDEDGRRLRWIDPAGSLVRETRIEYCQMPSLIGGGDRLLCGGGADKYASVRMLDDPMTKRAFLRSPRSKETGSLLLGSDFRLVDDRYLIYMSIDGTLMGTVVHNLDSLTVGRSVALVPHVRRGVYLGAGSYDLTTNGTLVYLPGLNAEVGHLVQRMRDGRLTTLNVSPAAHLRFSPSPDGRRLATVVEGVQQQELRVYDLRDGTYESYDQGFYLSAPAWSPDGTRLVYRRDSAPGQEALLLRRLDSPEAPRALLPGQGTMVTQPSSWLADDFLLVGAGTNAAQALLLNPAVTPTSVDSLGFSSFFTSISPDRRWIAAQNQGAAGIRLMPWPAMDRVYQVDAEGIEPRWRSATELAFQLPGASVIHQVTIDHASGSPVGPRQLVTQDPRFVDTPGWSFAFTRDGDLVYLQAPAGDAGHYLRVVPDWLRQLKRVVDEANR